MMVSVQQKVHSAATYREKIQVLTLCSPAWAIKKSAEFFSASEYAIRAARKLARGQGILSLPDRRHGKEIPDGILDQAHECYHDDEFFRIIPGKKDFVSIGRNKHAQSSSFFAILNSYALLSERNIWMQRLPFPSPVPCDQNGVFWLEHKEHIPFAYVQYIRT